jgi:predicted RNase H-like nuclease (RuvC/YqgF family)
MNDFYNAEYLSERVAALAQERDDLKRMVRKQHDIIERLMAELRECGCVEDDVDG